MYVVGDSPLDELFTATEAATELGISVSTVKQWARRGYLDESNTRRLLEPSGLNERDWPMYRLRDVMQAEKHTRRRAGRQYPTAA